MNNQFEIEKTFVASTAHCSGANEIDLLVVDNNIITDEYEYGIRVKVSSDYFPNINDLRKVVYSKGLCQCIYLAKTLECDWLRLDSDGLIYDEALHYEW